MRLSSINVKVSQQWSILVAKVGGSDTRVVSPYLSFFGEHYRLTIWAKMVHDGKGGRTFRLAKGCGDIEVMSHQDKDKGSDIMVRINVGTQHGVMANNFAKTFKCMVYPDPSNNGGADETGRWYFLPAEKSGTITISVEAEVVKGAKEADE